LLNNAQPIRLFDITLRREAVMNTSKVILLLLIAALVSAFFAFDLQHYLTLDSLKSQQVGIDEYRQAHPALTVALYAALYITVTALSLV
jgi:hypothetical protein